MKRIVLTLVAAIVLPSFVLAQDQGWGAKLFTNGLTHDFGSVAFGAQLTHKFTMTNPYNVPFRVSDARASCVCFEVKKPDQPIPPRGTAELEVVLDTRRVPQNQLNRVKTESIFVTFSSVPEQAGQKIFASAATLRVSCVANTAVRFNPDKINFGIVQAGQTPKLPLDVTNFGNANWQITEVVGNKFPLDVEVQPLKGAVGQVSYRVAVTLKKDAPAGQFKHEVQLKTNDPNTPVLSLLVEGMIQSALVAAPNNVDLGKVKVNTAVLRHVIVRGPAGTPFKITGVTGEGDGIKVKAPEKASTAHVLTIEYLPGAVGELKNKELTIKTDLAGGLSTVVTVAGEAVP
jgi:hypothetical protein